MIESGCVFCRIVAGAMQCALITEDDATLAFMDIHPANEGHCLVIPKRHYGTIFDIPPDTFAQIGRTAARIAVAVRNALNPAGLSLVQANGTAAGQTVWHLHVHVLPRRDGDGLMLNWPRTGSADSARIAELADRIRRHMPEGGMCLHSPAGPTAHH